MEGIKGWILDVDCCEEEGVPGGRRNASLVFLSTLVSVVGDERVELLEWIFLFEGDR